VQMSGLPGARAIKRGLSAGVHCCPVLLLTCFTGSGTDDRGDWHSFEPSAAIVHDYVAAFVRADEPHLPVVARLARACA